MEKFSYKKQNKSFLEALVVCVDYSDYLCHFITNNKKHFDNLVIVTSKSDVRTQQLCKDTDTNVVITDCMYEDNAYWLISTLAIPYSKELNYDRNKSIILDEFISEDKYIDWEVPEGKWKVISFFMCNTGQPLMVPSPNSIGPMIDHLSRRATRNHFDTIISRLATVSTKENQLKFLEVDSYEVWDAVDWSPELIKEFKSHTNR